MAKLKQTGQEAQRIEKELRVRLNQAETTARTSSELATVFVSENTSLLAQVAGLNTELAAQTERAEKLKREKDARSA